MNQPYDDLVRVIGGVCGKDISPYDASFLTKSLEKRLIATASPDAPAYLERLGWDCTEAEAFCRSLSITHSEFFRNPLAFALLESVILPRLAQDCGRTGRAAIRVWSAGCAAGQEAYSIAMLLDEINALQGPAASARIFATDIVDSELDTARRGAYPAAAMQNVRLRHLRRYFVESGESYTLIPRIRERVDFSRFDLLDPGSPCPPASIFGDFDLVFCSNTLIYYRPEVRLSILDRIRGCLATEGYLVTGEAERKVVEQAGGFAPVMPPAPLFRKVRCRP